MSQDIANRLTDFGKECIFRKLFDESVTYNEAFYSDEDTLLKLRVYQDDTNYIESSTELAILESSYIKLSYIFDQIDFNIVSIAIYNNDSPTMIFDELDINNLSIDNNHNKLTSIDLIYKLVITTPCIPSEAYPYFLGSLINLNNTKINKMYIGKGEPDLSGASSNLTDYVSSYDLQSIRYYSDHILMMIKGEGDEISQSDITELGIGFDIDENTYQLCTLQSVDFSKMGSSGKYIIELDLALVNNDEDYVTKDYLEHEFLLYELLPDPPENTNKIWINNGVPYYYDINDNSWKMLVSTTDKIIVD